MSQKNSCSGGPKLIFACSGAADVGEITDKAARQLTKEGVGKMFCTVGIGGRIHGIMKTARDAAAILAIDGCPLNCAKGTLENAGLSSFTHLQLADLGMQKGSTPPTEDNIGKVLRKATEIFAA